MVSLAQVSNVLSTKKWALSVSFQKKTLIGLKTEKQYLIFGLENIIQRNSWTWTQTFPEGVAFLCVVYHDTSLPDIIH